MIRRIVTCAALSIWIGVTFNGSIALKQQPSRRPTKYFKNYLSRTATASDIRQGKIVKWSATEGVGSGTGGWHGLAGQDKKPRILSNSFVEASAYKEETSVTAHGKIAGDGTLADFAGVKLEPNGEKEARRYLEAKPGEELNLDAKEIAAFRALKPAGGKVAVSVEEVEALVRQTLLSRYQAYRAKGLGRHRTLRA